ncbi:HAD family hydrolase [Kribbella italica]|uniref:Putative hydrolase of the HAD superfamily n=1 Tax=Kribbella italica TaxID=1540520 RepID=A0A7W9JG67_9ACTN|nr:HAD family hydrolase [Kribbella italica]MBB5841556.1 putative hydrolase of the HAD superfamily [Kribbella italica]
MRRALLVDLFSTLIPGGHAERDLVHREMAQVLGVEPAAFEAAFRATAYERFTGAYGDLPSTLREITRRSGGRPTDDQLHQAAALRRALARQLIAGAPASTLSALAKLRDLGWRIALVSNITSETQLQWADSALAPYFAFTAFSAELGSAKPEAAIYLAACEGLGVAPGECVYVADGADNELAGAVELGMHAVRTTEHADSDPAWAGPAISSFAEVPALVGSPA